VITDVRERHGRYGAIRCHPFVPTLPVIILTRTDVPDAVGAQRGVVAYLPNRSTANSSRSRSAGRQGLGYRGRRERRGYRGARKSSRAAGHGSTTASRVSAVRFGILIRGVAPARAVSARHPSCQPPPCAAVRHGQLRPSPRRCSNRSSRHRKGSLPARARSRRADPRTVAPCCCEIGDMPLPFRRNCCARCRSELRQWGQR
jgi:hypothetical protein